MDGKIIESLKNNLPNALTNFLKKLYHVVFAFFILGNLILTAESADLRIHFIDVGEGDSVLIQTPNDNAVLIDTGNLITGFNVIRYLNQKGINNLSHLILTHPHIDHIGGIFFVLQMKNIGNVYDNGQDLTQITKSSEIYRSYEELVRRHNNYNVLKAGDRFIIDGVNFDILWPDEHMYLYDINANSLVIMVRFKEFSCLLAGDITTEAEKELLKENKDVKADILKISHHGSEDSNCEVFLKRVSPEIAIVSVDKNHHHKYPSKLVLNRLKMLKSKIYRTDKHGNITIETDGQSKTRVFAEK